MLPESSLPQLKAQLGNIESGTINVTPSLYTCSTHNFLAMKVFNTIPNKEKYILKRQSITVRTGSGKESALAFYCKFPLHTKDINGRQYIFHIPIWVVQFFTIRILFG